MPLVSLSPMNSYECDHESISKFENRKSESGATDFSTETQVRHFEIIFHDYYDVNVHECALCTTVLRDELYPLDVAIK